MSLRRRCRRLAAAALPALATLGSAGAANAHEVHHTAARQHETGGVLSAVAIGTVVAVSLVLSGMVFASAITGWPRRRSRHRAVVLALATAALLVEALSIVVSNPGGDVLGAWGPGLVLAQLVLVVIVAIPPTRATVPGAVALIVVLAAAIGGPLDTPYGIVMAVHLGAAALWLGCVAQALVEHDRSTIRRLAPAAWLGAGVVVLTGIINAKLHTGDLDTLTQSTYGHILVAKVILVGVALVAAWFALRRVRTRLVEAGAMTGVLVLAGALLAVGAPAVAVTRYRLAESMDATTRDQPECQARRLGHVLAIDEANRVEQGARFSIAPGRDRPVDGVLPGCDGAPVTASTRAARFNSVAEASPDETGAAYGRFLRNLGDHTVTVVIDGTPRSQTFVASLAAALPGVEIRTVPVDEALPPDAGSVIVATGWDGAATALSRLQQFPNSGGRGVFLAPWLLVPSLLGDASPSASQQVSIGLAVDPAGTGAVRYLAALHRAAPDQQPTGAGLTGYLEARVAMRALVNHLRPTSRPGRTTLDALARVETGGPEIHGLRFFTPANVSFLPPEFAHEHDHGGPAWLTTGALAPISGVVPYGGQPASS